MFPEFFRFICYIHLVAMATPKTHENTCFEKEFQCFNGKCISIKWLCDGEVDCQIAEDEINCPIHCSATLFQCANGRCIMQNWLCDGQVDCEGGEDETGCPVKCTKSQYQCSNRKCIPETWRCDGDSDCVDGGDEEGCYNSSCSENQFHCESGLCIQMSWRCDGDFDCQGHDDEASCEEYNATRIQNICKNQTEFKCNLDVACIHKTLVCNGMQDCSDGSDEENCTTSSQVQTTTQAQTATQDQTTTQAQTATQDQTTTQAQTATLDQTTTQAQTATQTQTMTESITSTFVSLTTSPIIQTPLCENISHFRCRNGLCIHKNWLCDGYLDCSDGSDEENCDFSSCKEGKHHCDAVRCIPAQWLCDGKMDCQDQSDEQNCDWNVTTQTPTESPTDNIPDVIWVYLGQKWNILRFKFNYTLNSNTMSTDLETFVNKDPAGSVYTGIDTDVRQNLLFYSDLMHKTIYRRNVSDNDTVRPIVEGVKAEFIAVDWVFGNVYWTEPVRHAIGVSNYDGNYTKTLLSHDVEKPRAIAVNPNKGVLVWTDWGYEPKIERSDLDGTNRQVLVNKSFPLLWPNGITIDYEEDNLYWVDAKHDYVAKSNLDGTDQQILFSRDNLHLFSMTMVQEWILFTDWYTNAVYSITLKDTSARLVEDLPYLGTVTGLASADPRRQLNPVLNVSAKCHEADCDHLCVPATPYHELSSLVQEVKCLCGDNLFLQLDGKTCGPTKPPEGILYYSFSDTVYKVSIDVDEARLNLTSDVTELVDLGYNIDTAAMDVDENANLLFWSQYEDSTIRRLEFGSNKTEGEVVIAEFNSADGIALDRLFHQVYWTDLGLRTIAAADYDGRNRRTIINKNLLQPRALALDPWKGYMYWTDIAVSPKIERSGMDGSLREILITEGFGLGWPNAITIDYEEDRIYWADGKLHTMGSARTDGTDKRLIDVAGMGFPISLTIFRDWLIWGETSDRSIMAVPKNGQQGRPLPIQLLWVTHWIGVRAFESRQQIFDGQCPTWVVRSGHHVAVHDQTCYMFVDEEKTWMEARAYCNKVGGELLTIKDKKTMVFIKTELDLQELGWNVSGVWNGAKSVKKQRWKWTTGERLTYTNWAKGKPKKGLLVSLSGERCACMSQSEDWRWHDYPCDLNSFSYNFICQFSKDWSSKDICKGAGCDDTCVPVPSPSTPSVVPPVQCL